MRRLPGWRRRTASVVLGIALLGALAFGVSQALAGNGHAVSQIRNHRDNCAAPSSNRVIGTATFDRKGNTVTVRVSINKGQPGNYLALLVVPAGPGYCGYIGSNAKFKVDASGNGSTTITVDITGFGPNFFLNATNLTTGDSNESDWVKL